MCLAVPGRITETWEADGLRMGRVDFDGVTRDVCLAYVPDAGKDDYVVVHVGFAISILNEEEAKESLEILRQLEDLEAELGPEDRS